MEFKDTNEFEKDQTHSSTENNNTELPNMTEERIQSVDATFPVEENESAASDKKDENAEIEETAVAGHTRATVQPEKNKKSYVKGFATTIAAGVIGSVLTLTILPHTDYLKNYYGADQNQAVTASNSNTQVKEVSAKPTVRTSGSIADTVEKVSKAIVGIVNYQQQQNNFYGTTNFSQSVESGSGSGVIFQKNNNIAYIVTNNHVVEGASKLEISLYDGQKTTAEVVGTDALTDLAVLKIDAKYVTATADFGDSSTLRPGDQVYAIGNPLGLDLSRTVTQGIVSATNRSISVSTSAGNWDTNVIQTDAAINPGNSGGALINPNGQVIGINSLKISESGVEGLGFAIPSNDLIPIVNQLIKNGKIERPYLGVGLADLDQVPQMYYQNLPNGVNKGVLVMNIDPNSAAARAGFQPKDLIVSMNGTAIANSSELRKYLYSKVKIGDEIKFEVYRDGKLQTLKVKLSANTTN
ncbi:S1C family serine protease [Neobacillus bataviensis]|uniref:S1C family serine protease n=1 Tax=Neobacillus bataviensis TaxID=220685 RepID=UPI001CBD0875|nr:trypsin-like peptidase domain-containing protein [Neobacillus bataviensis]